MSEAGWLARLAARAVWATRAVDRIYGRFDRLRARTIGDRASPPFYEAYNDVAFGGQAMYRPGTDVFRRDLFPWERAAIDEWFPGPPATVLVGGAGGGREAIALTRLGYAVTTFEPAERLVASFLNHRPDDAARIETCVGRYEELPIVRSPGGGRVDLSQRPPFDAAIFGWASYSNLLDDARRVASLRAMAALVEGPILLSYFPHHEDTPDSSSRRGSFSLNVGYFRDLTEAEVREQAAEAGVDIVWLLQDTGWPRAIVRRRR
jgi:hypothetical protein